jgi:hypothetical protein
VATKKQKRAAALAKREAFLEKVKTEGLEAQRRAKEEEEREFEILRSEARKINDRHRRIIAEALSEEI